MAYAKVRSYSPKPSNLGEPKSVRDAYDRQWSEERAKRESERQAAARSGKAGK